MLTRQQIIQNIEALEKQGATQDEIQEYLNSLKQPEAVVPKQEPINVQSLADREAAQDTSAIFSARTGEGPVTAGLKAVGNVPSSAFNLGKNLFQAVRHPVQTLGGLGKAVVGGVRTAGEATGLIEDVKDTESEQVFDALAQSLKERFGSLEALQRTATNDPVGFGADILPMLQGLKFATRGTQISKLANDAAAVIKQPIKVKANDIAIGQTQKAINLNPSDIRKIKQPNIAGKDPAEWLLERQFSGSQTSIANQLDTYRFATKEAVDTGLDALKVPIPVADAVSAIKTLEILKKTFEGTIGNEKLVASLDDMLLKGEFTLTELNSVKRMAQAELDVFKSTGVLKDSAKAKGLNNVMTELKELVEIKAADQGFDVVKALNKETQVAKEISDSLHKRLDVQSKLPEIGLRDGLLAVGGFATGLPFVGIGIVISKRILESSAFRTHLANKISTLPKARVLELETAIKQRNFTQIFEYLAPIINEYEEGSIEAPLSEESPL